MRRLVILVLLIAGLAAAYPATVQASSPPTGQIAFVRDGDIWIMDADGDNARRLTTSSRAEGKPAWSPDGRTIAFIRAGTGNGYNVCLNEIWLMNADGTNKRRLQFVLGPKVMPGTTHEQTWYGVSDLAWAPDGEDIAVGAGAQSWYPNMADGLFALQLYLIHSDGTQRRRVGPLLRGWAIQGLGWRPDGAELLLSASERFAGRLVSCDVASGTTSTPPYPGRGEWNPAWSPDGTRIAVCAIDDDGEASGLPFPRHLVIINQRTGEERDLWAGGWDGTVELHSTWSPDGRWLACSYAATGQGPGFDTLLLAADGSEFRLLEADAEDPAWKPTASSPTPTPTPTVTLKLSGLTSGAMRLGRSVTATGKVTPTSLAGSKVKLTVQKRGARWVTLKSVARTISASGAYSWKYKPAKKGAYRIRAAITKTAAHTAATTKWRSFKVK